MQSKERDSVQVCVFVCVCVCRQAHLAQLAQLAQYSYMSESTESWGEIVTTGEGTPR